MGILDEKKLDSLAFDPKRPNVEATCPFCGGTYMAGYRRDAKDTVAVIHTWPPCDRFTLEHPVTFLREARLAGASRRRIAT